MQDDDFGPYWVDRWMKRARGEEPTPAPAAKKAVPRKSQAHDLACGLKGSAKGGGRGGLHSIRRFDRLLGKADEE